MVQSVMPTPGMAVRQSENEVEADIVAFLQSRGWIVDRVQVGNYVTPDGRRISIGRRGQPDWRAKHPRLGYIEVEVKATGKRPSVLQAEYVAAMQSMGFAVTWADSLAKFEEWYFARFIDA